jgi:hypothetical protein
MITKFKIYETINSEEPQIGDYVLMNYFENDIGQIVDIVKAGLGMITINKYVINFDNAGLKTNFIKNHIKYWSSNREDLELILNARKYNL